MTRAAYEQNVPLEPFVYFPTRKNTFRKAPSAFATVDSDHVLLTAVKKAERGDGLILRFWEVAGQDTEFGVKVQGKEFRVSIGAHCLVTFRLDRDGTLTQVNLLEKAE